MLRTWGVDVQDTLFWYQFVQTSVLPWYYGKNGIENSAITSEVIITK